MKTDTKELGRMTKMAAVPIYHKNSLKIFFSRTSESIAMELSMKHEDAGPL